MPCAELSEYFGESTTGYCRWGIFAYTDRPDLVLRKLAEAARGKDFELFIYTGSKTPREPRRSAMSGREKHGGSSLYRSTVRLADDTKVSFPEWLQRLPDVFVSESSDSLMIRFEGIRPSDIPLLRTLEPEPADLKMFPPARHWVEQSDAGDWDE